VPTDEARIVPMSRHATTLAFGRGGSCAISSN
jgi:hypothetical protein